MSPGLQSVNRRAVTVMTALMVLWGVGLTWLAWRTGIQHDYPWYLQQWKLVGSAISPWASDEGFPPNTYGPLHTAFAPVAHLVPLGPKVLFTGFFALSSVALSYEVLVRHFTRSTMTLLVILLPLNFLVLGVAAVQGDNDALVAALVVVGLIAQLRRHPVLAGALLGAATLTKYYPVVLIAFFCLNGRRVTWRPLAGALTVIIPGFLLTLAIWGPRFTDALTVGGGRDATYLSPLRALDVLTGKQEGSLADLLIRNDALLVVLAVAGALLVSYALRLTWLQASAIGLWATLLSYKVGHAQYYLPFVLVLVALLAMPDVRTRRIVVAYLPLVGFLEAFQSLYFLQSQGWAATSIPLTDLSGIGTTVISVVTVLALVWALRSNSAEVTVATRAHAA